MQSMETVHIEYQKSVLGIFNLGVAIAHLKGKSALQAQFEAAQLAVVKLIKEQRKPTQEEASFLSGCFNLVDPLVGIQNKANLIRAVEFVDLMIEESKAQNLVSTENISVD